MRRFERTFQMSENSQELDCTIRLFVRFYQRVLEFHPYVIGICRFARREMMRIRHAP